MGKVGVLIVVEMLLLLITCSRIRSDDSNSTWCVEEERQALLTLKHSFGGDTVHRLRSWQGLDCCGWEGVSCDKSIRRVIRLDLQAPIETHAISSDYPILPPERLETTEFMISTGSTGRVLRVDPLANYVWEPLVAKEVNRSLTKLKYLKYLDLSFNDFSHSSIPEFLGDMKGLTYLNLSSAEFGGRVPTHLGNLSNLEFLNLSGNDLFVDDLRWVSGVSSLRHLDMGFVNLSQVRQVLTHLPSLLHLDLSHCGLNNTHFFSNFTFLPPTLHYLDLSANFFSGPIPDTLQNLTSLEVLHLSNNLFSGNIPTSLGRLSALTDLDLSYNKLNGTISTFLGQLSNLIRLDLSNNQLCGIISSEHHLANLSSLRTLRMSNNHRIILQTDPNWVPPFQLEYFEMRSCKFEPTQFPTWLQTQNRVYVLNLSNTSISDTFRLWLLEDKPFVRILDLSHNQIKGPLPRHLVNVSENLYEVCMQDNMLNGPIPNWFCNISINGTLDLSKNGFSGHIPDCWNNHQQLQVIDLSSNHLSGLIPSSFQNMASLQWVLLSNNNLVGPIPLGLRKLRLSTLDVGGNRLSGNIPTWMGESFPRLQILNLRNNMFNGTIPPQMCLLSFLQIMDLADNGLEGSLPKCLGNLAAMTVPDYSRGLFDSKDLVDQWSKSTIMQVLKGRELEYTSVLKFLVNMDLSGNRLVGSIPQELTQLLGLVGLNLARNQLSGSIPNNIGHMWSLQSLDLSRNQLSGKIPDTLSSLTFLSYLNLSSNNLEGKVPQGNQLQTLVDDDPSIYEANPRLCGYPLSQPCPGNNPTSNGFGGDVINKDEDSDLEKMWLYIVVMAGYATGFWVVVGVLMANKNWRHAYFMFVDQIKDNIYVYIVMKMRALKKKMKDTKPQ